MEQLSIVKIGSSIVNNTNILHTFLDDFAQLKGKKILIHGGGEIADTLLKKLDIAPHMIAGRRITNRETLEVVVMVYAGWINKTITAQLQGRNCQAIGLSGADAAVIQSHKRKHHSIDYGYVGDIDKVKSSFIQQLLRQEIVPIFCAVTYNRQGDLLNTNADTIATEVAIAMAKDFEVNLYYLLDKKGVLANPEDEHSVIPILDPNIYEKYKTAGSIAAGMIPKLDNAFHALKKGVSRVIIGTNDLLSNSDKPKTILSVKP